VDVLVPRKILPSFYKDATILESDKSTPLIENVLEKALFRAK
jgi:hypothetical protein